MAWMLLFAAGLVEIVMAIALKQSRGWTLAVPSVIGVAAALGSIVLLSAALKGLPVGTAYAIWTGIGAIGVTLVGIAHFGESASWPRLACVGLIFVGILGLRLNEA